MCNEFHIFPMPLYMAISHYGPRLPMLENKHDSFKVYSIPRLLSRGQMSIILILFYQADRGNINMKHIKRDFSLKPMV